MVKHIFFYVVLSSVFIHGIEVGLLKDYALQAVAHDIQHNLTLESLEKLSVLPSELQDLLYQYLLKTDILMLEVLNTVFDCRPFLKPVYECDLYKVVNSNQEKVYFGNTLQVAAISTFGNFIALGGEDTLSKRGIFSLVDIATSTVCYQIEYSQEISCVAISPKNTYIAVGSGIMTYLYDMKTGKELSQIKSYNKVNTLLFSADERFLFTGSKDTFIRKVDTQAKSITVLKGSISPKGHTAPVTCLTLSPTQELLLSGSYTGEVCIWNLRENKLIKTIKTSFLHIKEVLFLPSKDVFVVVENRPDMAKELWCLFKWDTLKNMHIEPHLLYGGYPSHLKSVSSYLVRILGLEREAAFLVQLWDIATGYLALEERRTLSHKENARSLLLASNGTFIFAMEGWKGKVMTLQEKKVPLLALLLAYYYDRAARREKVLTYKEHTLLTQLGMYLDPTLQEALTKSYALP